MCKLFRSERVWMYRMQIYFKIFLSMFCEFFMPFCFQADQGPPNQNIQILFAYVHTFLNWEGFWNFGLISNFASRKQIEPLKVLSYDFEPSKNLNYCQVDEFNFYTLSEYGMFSIWIFVYWNGRSLLLLFLFLWWFGNFQMWWFDSFRLIAISSLFSIHFINVNF